MHAYIHAYIHTYIHTHTVTYSVTTEEKRGTKGFRWAGRLLRLEKARKYAIPLVG